MSIPAATGAGYTAIPITSIRPHQPRESAIDLAKLYSAPPKKTKWEVKSYNKTGNKIALELVSHTVSVGEEGDAMCFYTVTFE